MIEYLKGKLAELTPTLAVIECHGVGYGVNISLYTYESLQGKEDVKLWIQESIREDAYQLWGFSERAERDLFILLISVSGIGASTARMILSAMSPSELCNVIRNGDEKFFKRVKGIGPKGAQRIIVDLHDKIDALPIATDGNNQAELPTGAEASLNKEVMQEAISALTMLGFSPAPSHKVVVKILHEEPTCPVERVIKLALKML